MTFIIEQRDYSDDGDKIMHRHNFAEKVVDYDEESVESLFIWLVEKKNLKLDEFTLYVERSKGDKVLKKDDKSKLVKKKIPGYRPHILIQLKNGVSPPFHEVMNRS